MCCKQVIFLTYSNSQSCTIEPPFQIGPAVQMQRIRRFVHPLNDPLESHAESVNNQLAL